MIRLFSRNAETFYNFRTGAKISVWPRYLMIASAALILSIIVQDGLGDFANLSVAILAIFVGFSFAILFFIVSNSQADEAPRAPGEDLELDIEVERLEKLKKELFYNLSYFNFVSLFSCVILLIHSVSVIGLITHIFGKIAASYYSTYFVGFGQFLAFLLVIEAFLTFFRITRRITFYFEHKAAVR